tara:strand:+ start:104 stop:376 length:273 start_codon:yes stop_codon:yes gene_type:complete
MVLCTNLFFFFLPLKTATMLLTGRNHQLLNIPVGRGVFLFNCLDHTARELAMTNAGPFTMADAAHAALVRGHSQLQQNRKLFIFRFILAQ